jgi:tetratricopeptide (TPR) repeat protein
MLMRHLLFAGVVALGSVASLDAAEARAPAAEPDPKGMELYQTGQAAYDGGDYRVAIESFKAAFDILGDSNLLYNIAVCYDRLDEFDAAIEHYERYKAVADESEHAAVDRKIASARERKRKAEAEAEAPPTESGEGPPPTEQNQPSATGVRTDAKPSEEVRIFGPAAWALTATAVVAYGLGIGFGVVSMQRGDDAEDGCPEVDGNRICSQRGGDDLSAARRFGITADVSLAVGGALTVALIAVLASNAVRRKRARADVARLQVRPTGLGVSGRF